METINNIASSASKLIYGDPKAESGQEPISGQSGRGTVDEPFDSGNLEERQSGTENLTANPASNPVEPESLPDRTRNFGESTDAQFPGGESNKFSGSTGADTTSSTSNPLSSGGAGIGGGSDHHSTTTPSSTLNPVSSSDDNYSTTTPSNPIHSGSNTDLNDHYSTTTPTTTGTGAAQGGAIRPEHDTAGTGVTSLHPTATPPIASDAPRPTEASSADPSTAKAGGFGTAEPSVGAHPASGAQSHQKQQGGDRPGAEPTTGEELAGVRGKKEEGEEALLGKRDPDDRSGEPLKVHGAKSGGGVEEVRDNKSKEEEEAEKGTGEKVVKQSAFKADGGDFDASLPGAGREADRLLEQKGVHKSGGPDTKDDVSPVRGDDDSGNGDKGKTSIGTKIKEKLHIGSKHKNGGSE
ncbi:hypothetical protein SLS54_006497 [Diplodia seriata]